MRSSSRTHRPPRRLGFESHDDRMEPGFVDSEPEQPPKKKKTKTTAVQAPEQQPEQPPPLDRDLALSVFTLGWFQKELASPDALSCPTAEARGIANLAIAVVARQPVMQPLWKAFANVLDPNVSLHQCIQIAQQRYKDDIKMRNHRICQHVAKDEYVLTDDDLRELSYKSARNPPLKLYTIASIRSVALKKHKSYAGLVAAKQEQV